MGRWRCHYSRDEWEGGFAFKSTAACKFQLPSGKVQWIKGSCIFLRTVWLYRRRSFTRPHGRTNFGIPKLINAFVILAVRTVHRYHKSARKRLRYYAVISINHTSSRNYHSQPIKRSGYSFEVGRPGAPKHAPLRADLWGLVIISHMELYLYLSLASINFRLCLFMVL